MQITVEQLQIAGIVVVVLIGLSFLGWIVRAVIGIHRGSPVYMLPDSSRDEERADEDDNGDGDVHAPTQ